VDGYFAMGAADQFAAVRIEAFAATPLAWLAVTTTRSFAVFRR
jgi:hypothetical protein